MQRSPLLAPSAPRDSTSRLDVVAALQTLHGHHFSPVHDAAALGLHSQRVQVPSTADLSMTDPPVCPASEDRPPAPLRTRRRACPETSHRHPPAG